LSPIPPDELAEVRIIGFPLAIQANAEEHLDDLLREFMLITAGNEQGLDTHIPRQLVELMDELRRDYDGITLEQDAQMLEAKESGVASVDLVYRVPHGVAAACTRLGDALDAADRYCLSGKHLLTLATPPEALELRRWYLGQFVTQIGGGEATSWSDWTSAKKAS